MCLTVIDKKCEIKSSLKCKECFINKIICKTDMNVQTSNNYSFLLLPKWCLYVAVVKLNYLSPYFKPVSSAGTACEHMGVPTVLALRVTVYPLALFLFSCNKYFPVFYKYFS